MSYNKKSIFSLKFYLHEVNYKRGFQNFKWSLAVEQILSLLIR